MMTNHGRYILNADGDPVPEEDFVTWGRWFESHDAERQIARDSLPDGALVSTVFLALDHQYGDGPPLLFETMVFHEGSARNLHCRRYPTRADALEGHAALVAELLGYAPTE